MSPSLSLQTRLNLRFGSKIKTGLAKRKVWLGKGHVQESSNRKVESQPSPHLTPSLDCGDSLHLSCLSGTIQ